MRFALEARVELIDQRLARGNVELDDVRIRDVIEVLHQSPQAVAVGDDEHAPAAPDPGILEAD